MTNRVDLDRIDLMTDLETWGIGPNAVVRAVAMVAFNPWTGEVVDTQVWDWRGLTDCQLELGRSVDAKAVRWWRKRSGSRLGDLLVGCCAPEMAIAPSSMGKALGQLEAFALANDPFCCWSRGDFDYPILSSLLDQMGGGAFWEFWQLRDVRTLDDLAPKVKPDIPHHPLSDCLAQIAQVRAALALVPREEAA